MNEKLQKLILTRENPGDFTHTSISTNELELAEKELHVTLPKQYVDFLVCYGHGGIGGIEIIIIGPERRCPNETAYCDRCPDESD